MDPLQYGPEPFVRKHLGKPAKMGGEHFRKFSIFPSNVGCFFVFFVVGGGGGVNSDKIGKVFLQKLGSDLVVQSSC